MSARRNRVSREMRTANDPKKFLPLPAAILLTIAFFLSSQLLSPGEEILIVASSAGLTFLLIVLNSSYMATAVCPVLSVLFVFAYYLFRAIALQTPIHVDLSFMNVFHIGLLWFSGFFCMVLIRLLRTGRNDTPARRADFGRAFRLSTIVFLIAYIALLAWLFIGMRPVGSDTQQSLNLIPFRGAFAIYWPHIASGNLYGEIFVQFFGNLLIFTPLGFFLRVYAKKLPKILLILLPFAIAGAIEATQYFLHMGKSDIDDAWMNVVGYFLGVLLYAFIGIVRKARTHGKETHIF